jgi:hypothetical protein
MLASMLQDGMLYMFNLPSSPADAAAAAAAAGAASQQPAASGPAAVGAPVAGSELMVKGLPDWEPLASQIFRRFVEAIMSKLEEQQQQHGQAAAAGAQGAGTEQQQQQQGYATADAAVAAVQRLLRGGASAMQAAAAALSSRQAANQQQQQRGQPQELWTAGEMSAAMQEAPGSVAQADAAIAAGERLLGFAVQELADDCPAAAQLKPRFQFGSRQQQHCMSSWEQRARNVAQLLQVGGISRMLNLPCIALTLDAVPAAVVACKCCGIFLAALLGACSVSVLNIKFPTSH